MHLLSPSLVASTAFVYTLLSSTSARPQLPKPPQRRADSTNSLLGVAYYGQGPDQPALSTFCEDSSLDIIPIAFVDGLPSANNGWPAMNFGDACGDYFYNGTIQTASLTNCQTLASDISQCQRAGKKIFISIGGGMADVQLESEEEAIAFADQLWDIFGPYDSSYTGPRPFGTTAVDGFDFDLESGDGSYWADVASTLRSKFSNGAYYLSAAPQCLTTDIMAPMIKSVYFDYIWVQYYNTPECSARNFFDKGDLRSAIGFDTWATVLKESANPNVPLFIGLPGSAAAAPTYPDDVLSVAETDVLINTFGCLSNSINPSFGGIMLWDATYAKDNDNFAAGIRPALDSPCSLQSSASASTTASTTSTVIATAPTTSYRFTTATTLMTSATPYSTPAVITSVSSYTISAVSYSSPTPISSVDFSTLSSYVASVESSAYSAITSAADHSPTPSESVTTSLTAQIISTSAPAKPSAWDATGWNPSRWAFARGHPAP